MTPPAGLCRESSRPKAGEALRGFLGQPADSLSPPDPRAVGRMTLWGHLWLWAPLSVNRDHLLCVIT